jgi:hypothetical protein
MGETGALISSIFHGNFEEKAFQYEKTAAKNGFSWG